VAAFSAINQYDRLSIHLLCCVPLTTHTTSYLGVRERLHIPMAAAAAAGAAAGAADRQHACDVILCIVNERVAMHAHHEQITCSPSKQDKQ
jgi:hypothetical protein